MEALEKLGYTEIVLVLVLAYRGSREVGLYRHAKMQLVQKFEV